MRSMGIRSVRCAAALLVMVGAAGCSGSDSGDPGSSSTTAAGSSPEVEAVEVVTAYWDERVRVESAADYESADFDDILIPSLKQEVDARYDTYSSMGFRREGEPELRDFEATVDGSTALVTGCVNEGDWTAVADVENVEQPEDEFYAIAYPLEQTDGTWLMTNEGENAPKDFTC